MLRKQTYGVLLFSTTKAEFTWIRRHIGEQPRIHHLREKKQVFISNYNEFTNFFLATSPQTPFSMSFSDALLTISKTTNPEISIQQQAPELKKMFAEHNISNFISHLPVGIQGAFSIYEQTKIKMDLQEDTYPVAFLTTDSFFSITDKTQAKHNAASVPSVTSHMNELTDAPAK